MLVAATSAGAEPYVSRASGFEADFRRSKITVERGAAASWGPFESYHPAVAWSRRGNFVLVTSSSKNPRALLELLLKEEKGLQEIERRPVRRQNYPALLWSGLDRDGAPTSVLCVQARNRGYVVISCDFDLAEQRRFLNSFRILGTKKPAPARSELPVDAPYQF